MGKFSVVGVVKRLLSWTKDFLSWQPTGGTLSYKGPMADFLMRNSVQLGAHLMENSYSFPVYGFDRVWLQISHEELERLRTMLWIRVPQRVLSVWVERGDNGKLNVSSVYVIFEPVFKYYPGGCKRVIGVRCVEGDCLKAHGVVGFDRGSRDWEYV